MKCSIEECGRDSRVKGYCHKHYLRFHRYGDPLIVPKLGQPKLTFEGWRTSFETRYGAGKFDYLSEAFFGNCQTLEAIGGQFGVTRESVRQWRNKIRHWRPEFVSQRTQRKYCTLLKLPERIEAAKAEFAPPPALVYCKQRAEEIGCKVEFVRRETLSIIFTLNKLLIDGELWRVSSINSIFRQGSRGYFQFDNCVNKNRIVCCFHDEKPIAFILPMSVLTPFGNSIYIPVDLEKPVYQGRPHRVDWKFYREAWHLLKKTGG